MYMCQTINCQTSNQNSILSFRRTIDVEICTSPDLQWVDVLWVEVMQLSESVFTHCWQYTVSGCKPTLESDVDVRDYGRLRKLDGYVLWGTLCECDCVSVVHTETLVHTHTHTHTNGTFDGALCQHNTPSVNNLIGVTTAGMTGLWGHESMHPGFMVISM